LETKLDKSEYVPYDDAKIKADIAELETAVGGIVEKV